MTFYIYFAVIVHVLLIKCVLLFLFPNSISSDSATLTALELQLESTLADVQEENDEELDVEWEDNAYSETG